MLVGTLAGAAPGRRARGEGRGRQEDFVSVRAHPCAFVSMPPAQGLVSPSTGNTCVDTDTANTHTHARSNPGTHTCTCIHAHPHARTCWELLRPRRSALRLGSLCCSAVAATTAAAALDHRASRPPMQQLLTRGPGRLQAVPVPAHSTHAHSENLCAPCSPVQGALATVHQTQAHAGYTRACTHSRASRTIARGRPQRAQADPHPTCAGCSPTTQTDPHALSQADPHPAHAGCSPTSPPLLQAKRHPQSTSTQSHHLHLALGTRARPCALIPCQAAGPTTPLPALPPALIRRDHVSASPARLVV